MKYLSKLKSLNQITVGGLAHVVDEIDENEIGQALFTKGMFTQFCQSYQPEEMDEFVRAICTFNNSKKFRG